MYSFFLGGGGGANFMFPSKKRRVIGNIDKLI